MFTYAVHPVNIEQVLLSQAQPTVYAHVVEFRSPQYVGNVTTLVSDILQVPKINKIHYPTR